MKKSTKLYIVSLSSVLFLFLFTFSRAQEDKNEFKSLYNEYILLSDAVTLGENLETLETSLLNIEDKFFEDVNVYLQKARIYDKMEKYEEAEESILKIYELRPDLEDNTDILALYANVAFLSGDHEKAGELSNKLKELGGE